MKNRTMLVLGILAVVSLAFAQYDSWNVELVGRALGGSCFAAYVVGDYCYIGGGERFMVVDVSDPTTPVEVGYCYSPGGIMDIIVVDGLAYLANGGVGAVHMTGCEVYWAVSVTDLGMTLYAEGNVFTVAGVTLSNSATGEFKSNHFVRCTNGVTVNTLANLTAIANDFNLCVTSGISIADAQSVSIMNNRKIGGEITATGIVNTLSPVGNVEIQGNDISSYQTGMDIQYAPGTGTCIVTHNTLISNVVLDLNPSSAITQLMPI